MSTEDELYYNFLSKKEKAQYRKKPYIGALILFISVSVVQIICVTFLHFALSKPDGWAIPCILTLGCIFSSCCWKMSVQTYNTAMRAKFWEELNINFSLPPHGWFCILCAIILPLVDTSVMIIVAIAQPELKILAPFGAVTSFICLVINCFLYLEIRKS